MEAHDIFSLVFLVAIAIIIVMAVFRPVSGTGPAMPAAVESVQPDSPGQPVTKSASAVATVDKPTATPAPASASAATSPPAVPAVSAPGGVVAAVADQDLSGYAGDEFSPYSVVDNEPCKGAGLTRPSA